MVTHCYIMHSNTSFIWLVLRALQSSGGLYVAVCVVMVRRPGKADKQSTDHKLPCTQLAGDVFAFDWATFCSTQTKTRPLLMFSPFTQLHTAAKCYYSGFLAALKSRRYHKEHG